MQTTKKELYTLTLFSCVLLFHSAMKVVSVYFFVVVTVLFYFVLKVVHPKTDEQRCRLQEACKDILLFKNLDQVRSF